MLLIPSMNAQNGAVSVKLWPCLFNKQAKRKQFLSRLNFGVFSDAAEGVSPDYLGLSAKCCVRVPLKLFGGGWPNNLGETIWVSTDV